LFLSSAILCYNGTIMTTTQNWHSLDLNQVFKELKTDKNGLDSQIVATRLKEFGYNRLPREKKTTALEILVNQIKSPLVYVLLIAVVMSLFLGKVTDALVILAIVVINSLIGFFQENKANQAITKLKTFIHFQSKVWRDGKQTVVDTEEIVPGDVIVLEAGTKVSADCRLISSTNLVVDESVLTGESMPSSKNPGIFPVGVIPADRENMLFMGTAVVGGRGLAVVCGTGKNTELGQIAILVKETAEEQTPLQDKINRLARFLAVTILIIAVLLFVFGIWGGRDIVEMFLVSVAVAVAAIPEGLVVALTVILVIGTQKILKMGSLVRRLVAAETLGSTTVICSDKTGTLTEGKMRLVSVLTGGEDFKFGGVDNTNLPADVMLALEIGMLCNDSLNINPKKQLEHAKFVGDPTEVALVMAGMAIDLDQEQLNKKYPRVNEVPFASEKMYMATLHQGFRGHYGLLVKGAPEKILAMATTINIGNKKVKLTAAEREKLIKGFEKLTVQGLRLLGVAYREFADLPDDLELELKDLNFIGIMVLKDPLRNDAKDTIKLCIAAGIRPIIITGDHKLTALTIAREIGLAASEDLVLAGVDLDNLDDEAFAKTVKKVSVYARVEPRHKIRIVDELQRQGEVVAMAGDGVNDAPAIKSADIGIALGSGTDVAKETADIVLLNDNFSTIVEAVRGGRIIFDNIRKVILYLLFSSFSEVFLIGAAIIAGLPLPLLAVQILWVNIVQDSLPVFALAADSEEPGIMQEKPRGRKSVIFNTEMKVLILPVAFVVNLLVLAIVSYFYHLGREIEYIRTFSFMAIAVGSLFYIYSCRSRRQFIWHRNPLDNHYVNGAVLIGIILMLGAVYLPFLQKLLHTIPLAFGDWLILVSIGVLNLLAMEITKAIFRYKKSSREAV